MFVPCFPFFKCLSAFFNKNKPLLSYCMIGPVAVTIMIIITIIISLPLLLLYHFPYHYYYRFLIFFLFLLLIKQFIFLHFLPFFLDLRPHCFGLDPRKITVLSICCNVNDFFIFYFAAP